jgi:SAM-dependent methyltransferase
MNISETSPEGEVRTGPGSQTCQDEIAESAEEAFRQMITFGDNIKALEVRPDNNAGAHVTAEALPLPMLQRIADEKNFSLISWHGGQLPYTNEAFDLVIMDLSQTNFPTLYTPFREANRVLKDHGALVIGFLDRHSLSWDAAQAENTMWAEIRANTFSSRKILFELSETGFRNVEISQTLFHPKQKNTGAHDVRSGFGQGLFVVIKAVKKKRKTRL